MGGRVRECRVLPDNRLAHEFLVILPDGVACPRADVHALVESVEEDVYVLEDIFKLVLDVAECLDRKSVV